jgi:hypothetical protein
MLEDLGSPVYTVVDDDDHDEVFARWSSMGFAGHRREVEFLVPTDPETTGLIGLTPRPGVRVLPRGRRDGSATTRDGEETARTGSATAKGRQHG